MTYEGAFFVVSLLAKNEMDAYALSIVARIFEVNLMVFSSLLILNRLAVATGLLKSQEKASTAA